MRDNQRCVVCGTDCSNEGLVDQRRDSFGELVSLCRNHKHLITRPK